jgi:hypothetical protein
VVIGCSPVILSGELHPSFLFFSKGPLSVAGQSACIMREQWVGLPVQGVEREGTMFGTGPAEVPTFARKGNLKNGRFLNPATDY